MNEDEGQEEDENETTLTPEEKKRNEELDKEYQRDIKVMESLFPDQKARSKRLLAELECHQAPINCVRWNYLGTIFASADDEGNIFLWHFRGKKVLSAF